MQKDLQLTPEQIAKLEEIRREEIVRARSREEAQNLGAQMLAKQLANLPKRLALLTPDQTRRLSEYYWQFYGGFAIRDPELAKALNLSQEQQTKLDSIVEEVYEKQRAIRGPEGATDIRKLRDTAVDELLTAEQREQLDKLRGKKIDFAVLSRTSVPAGFGPPAGFGAPASSSQLVSGPSAFTNTVLRKELAITDEQAQKIDALVKENRESTSPNFALIRDLPSAERTQKTREMIEKAQRASTELEKKLSELLTAKQSERLKEIRLQALGALALLRPEIAAEFNLMPEQTKKNAAIVRDFGAKIRELGPPSTDEVRARSSELNKFRDAEILELLTDEQKQQFAAKKGEAFDFSKLQEAQPRPFGFRGAPPAVLPPAK